MKRIIELLNQPHPAHSNPRIYLRTITIISLVSFFILYVIRPFDWSEVEASGLLITALVCSAGTFAGMTLFYLWRYVFPAFFEERHWTIGKEVVFVLYQLTVVSLVVWGVRSYCGQYWYVPQCSYLFTWWVVCATGAIPYLLATSLKHYCQLQRYLAELGEKRTDLGGLGDWGMDGRFVLPRDLGAIYGFLFAESIDNYVMVYWLADGEINRERFRCTLLELETYNPQPMVFRCHRAFIANLATVIHVQGNAAGFQLLLHAGLPAVPVSRSYVPAFRRLMAEQQVSMG